MLDATLEYYPGDGQIAALGLFYKQFRDYILSIAAILYLGYDFPGLMGTITQVQSFSNGPAHVEGIEGQYQQQLKFLRPPFDGIGFSGNFTLVDSKALDPPGLSIGLLPSTSKVTWNAAVFYGPGPLRGASGGRLCRPESVRLRQHDWQSSSMCIHAIG